MPPGIPGVGGGVMVGTVWLVVVVTLAALAVVLYAAYCEAGEDLPCKKVTRRKKKLSSPTGMGPEGGRGGV